MSFQSDLQNYVEIQPLVISSLKMSGYFLTIFTSQTLAFPLFLKNIKLRDLRKALQLPLPIHQIDEDTFENFYSQNSEVLLESLKRNFTDVQQPFFYIWGGKSCGKSHLLKAVSNHFLLNHQTSSYIPLTKANYFSPLVLDNAELLNVICLDDIQAIAGDAEWELAIFNLFNQIREQQGLFNEGQKPYC